MIWFRKLILKWMFPDEYAYRAKREAMLKRFFSAIKSEDALRYRHRLQKALDRVWR